MNKPCSLRANEGDSNITMGYKDHESNIPLAPNSPFLAPRKCSDACIAQSTKMTF